MNGQPAAERKSSILQHALVVAEKHGYHQMTREQIAKAADVSPALVSHYLGTMVAMRRAVMRAAVERRNAQVVAQGLALKDKQALKADAQLRADAGACLVAR